MPRYLPQLTLSSSLGTFWAPLAGRRDRAILHELPAFHPRHTVLGWGIRLVTRGIPVKERGRRRAGAFQGDERSSVNAHGSAVGFRARGDKVIHDVRSRSNPPHTLGSAALRGLSLHARQQLGA